MVAWIVRALFSHSVEEYVLAIGGSNPALGMLYQLTSGRNTMLQYTLQVAGSPFGEVYDIGPRVLAVNNNDGNLTFDP